MKSQKLVLQVKHFLNHNGNFIKDMKKTQCMETLSVTVFVDISFFNRFNLVATVNHTRTLDKRH